MDRFVWVLLFVCVVSFSCFTYLYGEAMASIGYIDGYTNGVAETTRMFKEAAK